MGDRASHSRPTLEAAGLTVGYLPDRPIIRDLSFTLTGPGVVRLDAPNGAGKSTLIEAASGYLRPLAGNIRINGKDAHDRAVRARHRVCRAAPALHPYLSLLDHLALSADLAGIDREEPRTRAQKFGLDRWSDTRTSALSTGTAGKLWYVMCTTGRFSVALLDEPFNGVDQESTKQMIDEMNQWAEESLLVIVCHTVPPNLRIRSTLSIDGQSRHEETV